MAFKLGLAQTCNGDAYDAIEDVRSFCARAQEAGVDLLVFPESLMTPFELDIPDFIDAAQPLDGAFASSVNALAEEHGLWIVYTMNERSSSDEKPCNTAVVVDSEGTVRAFYRKTHLFDSSTHTESSKMSAGDEVFPVLETPFARIGLGICYDLRFPEYARCEALDGCELMLYPAAWVDGENKALQWSTLLRARAIENAFFVAGICRASQGYVGESFAYAPDGVELACSTPKTRDLVVVDIDLERIKAMREAIPSLQHRRPELYAPLSEGSRTPATDRS